MTDTVYHKFVKRWEEITDIPPQTVGPLTPYYKRTVKRLKVMPWPMLVMSSLLIVSGLYVFFGSTITLLVSVLQRGF
ncbi:hypothetical protein A3A63_03005 [Candidatus Gottesmanbacteria bacterium RIFCSPLOWO2_01_FULL_46_9]|uniref:Uncharacterized protein n=1 Tax=Candidatus Gottesmanbacteria bacterium RIFCSPLOWO2_01_FULL_46_9 TaxID=1798394 RepID=A0A1F6B0I2_9BACT|nr:MAG: hypothetical protein A3A63_03005 [Candidatus Gottesmanbacteria bacterium RIFCSPLOWO2_01_FULL_46_9]